MAFHRLFSPILFLCHSINRNAHTSTAAALVIRHYTSVLYAQNAYRKRKVRPIIDGEQLKWNAQFLLVARVGE